MKIKVCGLKYADNVSEVAGLNPDYIGFIFYPGSPRYMDGLKADVVKSTGPQITKTGVFVNHSFDAINALIAEYSLDAVQLHGFENPEFCERLKKHTTVIKAFGVNEDFNFDQLAPYLQFVDFFLFDTKSSKHGGTGQTFGWKVLQKYKYDVPFFLSGGLSPDNIEQALEIQHPQFYGVDLNSKFEISPGLKDIDKLQKGFYHIKQSVL